MPFIGNQKAIALIQQLKSNMHVLIVGPSGHGKTTLARLASDNLIEASSDNIKNRDDLYAYLKEVKEGSVFFIDEIHSLKPKLQEALYQLMEKNSIQIIEGRGTCKKFVNVKLPKFSIFAATTKEHMLCSSLKNRFLTIHLQPYEEIDLINIAKLHLNSDTETIQTIVDHSRGTPRELIRLCEMYKLFKCQSLEDTKKMIDILDIFEEGLSRTEVRVLSTLQKGPHSLHDLSSKLMVEQKVVENQHEPYLVQKGLILKNKHGREISINGMRYMAKIPMENRC